MLSRRWWRRYEVTMAGNPCYFMLRRDAMWALEMAATLCLRSAGRDRWTGKAL